MARRVISALALAATAVLVAACGGSSSSSGTVTLNWWAGNQPGGSFQKAAAYCSRKSNGEYKIKVNLLGTEPTPSASRWCAAWRRATARST